MNKEKYWNGGYGEDETRKRWRDLTKEEKKFRFKETTKDVSKTLAPIIGGAGLGTWLGSNLTKLNPNLYNAPGALGVVGGTLGAMIPPLYQAYKGMRERTKPERDRKKSLRKLKLEQNQTGGLKQKLSSRFLEPPSPRIFEDDRNL